MRVLLAEDEPALRLLYELWLKSDGFDVIAAADGREALAQVDDRGAPDVAVLDVLMPHVDGLEVCRRLRRLDDSMPIVLQTALDDIEIAAANAGATEVIPKPAGRAELLRPLRRLADQLPARASGCDGGPERPSRLNGMTRYQPGRVAG
jgi:two-component system response regulator MprA